MTYSFWLEQTVAVSRWLDASARVSATSLDRSPGFYTGGAAAMPQKNPAKGPRVLILISKFTTM
jgi:hypothetical protein